MRAVLVIIVGLALAAGLGSAPSAEAADDRDTARLQELTRSLIELLDRGARERLADPWYLRDLRDLIERYHWPWGRILLSDDFSTRSPRPAAPWRILAGDFRLDWRYGLRSVVEPPRRWQRRSERQQSGGDPIGQLFGQILRQALDPNQQQQAARPDQARQREYAAIVAPIEIPNVFAVELALTARALRQDGRGRFAIGPYLGSEAEAGYRLVFSAGGQADEPSLQLMRLGHRGGRAMIDFAAKPVVLDPETPRTILWTRRQDGLMTVSVDGAEVIRIRDRGFRRPFEGLLILNRRGDYAIRQIRVDGAD